MLIQIHLTGKNSLKNDTVLYTITFDALKEGETETVYTNNSIKNVSRVNNDSREEIKEESKNSDDALNSTFDTKE